MMDRADIVHENFLKRVAAADLPERVVALSPDRVGLRPSLVVEIFQSQVLSRQLDRVSRKLQSIGEGFYTIGSSGHEGNAAVAAAFRPDDMAFLHYRDAAFQIQRSKSVSGQTPTWDILLSFVASSDDPISGGRHKVLGSKRLFIPPQTSTIASHLPKAVGTAYSIGLARKLKISHRRLPVDSVVVCSFGDASANHSTAQGAFNAACWTAFQGVPMPVVFVCEDNGIGISTRTPAGWLEATFSERPALKYIQCNGLDMLDVYRAAREAQQYSRRHRRPVFLHMKCVRLFGHAGSDVQAAYMSKAEIEQAEYNDPLLHSAKTLIESGILGAQEILDIYNDAGAKVEAVAQHVISRPRLSNACQVMKSLVPPKREISPSNGSSVEERLAIFESDATSLEKPQHMARLINWALTDLMLENRSIVLAGQDIGPKGGVYNVTSKLFSKFGAKRVINTLLDEQSILGLAIGLAHNGFLPIPEIQFLAYFHNAEDQLRGEAATMSFFSNGQFTNPMVVRIAGLGYQKGFGGHFHNDNSLAVLRDIPGVIIACPSNGEDAVRMLRECVRLAQEEQRVVVFLEPIALYMTRDLHEEKDGLWLSKYPAPEAGAPLRVGEIHQYGSGTDLAIISYGNGYYLSRKAEKILSDKYGAAVRVIDLRWLAPLNEEQILSAVEECRCVLVVDECRKTGSQSEALMTLLIERGNLQQRIARIAAQDSFIPLGPSATATLPSCDQIVSVAGNLLRESLLRRRQVG